MSYGRADTHLMSSEHRRLTVALLLSLLIHALLLNLTFGAGGWLPGWLFPWQERRVDEPDLRVALVPAQPVAPEPPVPLPAPQGSTAQPPASEPTPSESRAPSPSTFRAPTPFIYRTPTG